VLKKTDVDAESGSATPEQAREVARGEFVTAGELAREIMYGKRWIVHLAKTGRIAAVKPTGGQWRIPVSEVKRLKEVGTPSRSGKVEEPLEEPNKVTVSGDHSRRISAGQQRTGEEEEIRIRTVSDLFGLFSRKDEE